MIAHAIEMKHKTKDHVQISQLCCMIYSQECQKGRKATWEPLRSPAHILMSSSGVSQHKQHIIYITKHLQWGYQITETINKDIYKYTVHFSPPHNAQYIMFLKSNVLGILKALLPHLDLHNVTQIFIFIFIYKINLHRQQ